MSDLSFLHVEVRHQTIQLHSQPNLMTYTINSARSIFPNTLAADVVPATTARFNQLSPEDQLAWIWFTYLEMGKTVTIAAPGAASMQLAELTLNDIKKMSFQQQTQVMCDLANRADTPICRTYAIWSQNIKLGFWYQLGEWMEKGIVAPIPEAQVSIEGVDNPTVLSYMNNLNANDFDALIALFLPDGALQPPFQRPIVGKDAVLRFFKEECQNLVLVPEKGVSEPADGGYTQIKITGKVQTPWFGSGVGMNISWRFLLDPNNKIFFVAIDLLASAKELVNFAR